MKNVKAYAVCGAGYGDEGKGLMADYFCQHGAIDGAKVLDVKVNGGAQAGHTVCRVSHAGGLRYDRNVFHTLGAGTLAGADTHLGQKFLLDALALKEEMDRVSRLFGLEPHVTIDPRCRVVLRSDIMLNRMAESLREAKHGTCGMGIFEAVNRNHKGFPLTVGSFMALCGNDAIGREIEALAKGYIGLRLSELKDEGLDVSGDDAPSVCIPLEQLIQQDISGLRVLLGGNRVGVCALADAIKDDYQHVVFECSQGLELDWGDARNSPHTTASHTGLVNVGKEIMSLPGIDNWLSFEACYVTRSYKTKHGAGHFHEEDMSVKDRWALYDRTNVLNGYQGALKFGTLDLGRMWELINHDVRRFEGIAGRRFAGSPSGIRPKYSLAVTHLDQTEEGILTDGGDVYFKELDAGKIFNHGGHNTYYSFGEKAGDVYACRAD